MKKSFARFFIALFITAFVCQSLCAAGSTSSDVKVPRKYRLAAYTKAVEKELGHKSESYELSIINTAYSYYSSQCQNKWDKQTWKDAVAKGVELCKNKIAIAAAKAGEFGEKVLKALVTATKDAAESISNWLDKKSEEYDNYMKEKDAEKQDYSMTQI